jgi:hypothetical protein
MVQTLKRKNKNMSSGVAVGLLLAGMVGIALLPNQTCAQNYGPQPEGNCNENLSYGGYLAATNANLLNTPSISPTVCPQIYGTALIIPTNVVLPQYSAAVECRTVSFYCPSPGTSNQNNNVSYTAGSVIWTRNFPTPMVSTDWPAALTNSFSAEAYVVCVSSDTNVFQALTNVLGTVTWCPITNSTNSTPGSIVLTNATLTPTYGAVGTSFSASVIQITNNAVVVVTTNCDCDSSFNGTFTTNPAPTVLTNWWTATVGTFSTNGTGTNTQAPFTPTAGGKGSVTFYVKFTDGCDTNLQTANASCDLCVSTNSTNCVTNGGVGLAITSTNTNFCFGTQVTLSATNLLTNAVLVVTTNCPWNTNLNTSWTTNVAPTIISNWWTVSGPGTSYTNYGTGLSTGSLSPLPTNGGTGTATFYVSFTTWTNTANSMPSYCTNTNSVQVPFNVIQISNVCEATYPTNLWRTNLGVGEFVDLSLVGAPAGTYSWSTTNSTATNLSGSLNVNSGPSVRFTAPSNAASVTVTVSYPGGSNTIPFSVFEPAANSGALRSKETFPAGTEGAGIEITVTVKPSVTNPLSFSRVFLIEIGENASSVTGYFADGNTNHAAFNHDSKAGANVWFLLDASNNWPHLGVGTGTNYDTADIYDYPSPWTNGSFEFDIPGQWKVGSGGFVNSNWLMWTQYMAIVNTNGSTTVGKFGISEQRDTNGTYTP